MLAKTGEPNDQKNLSKEEKIFFLSLGKQILRVKNKTSNSEMLGELGRFETQLFKYFCERRLLLT